MTDDARPDPERFLAEAKAEAGGAVPGRGRLKIFLGASPGVGKTYAMLEEAAARARAGTDVVVALAETHGRQETAALLAHLVQIPRRIITYRGRQLAEMDLDALLARRPQLALIDELAHTNVPGSRHPKRWQDVEEVLAAGIDVYSTLNIQHIESLNDLVARITGVRVQETVPDTVLQMAGEIKLIDLPPEDLIQRMREGKVYMPAEAGRALGNFFSRPNLTALRELALRTAASRVDAEMLALRRGTGQAASQDRLMVCLDDPATAKGLVRAGRRMTDRARIPWVVAMVGPVGCGLCGVDSIAAALPQVVRVAEGARFSPQDVGRAMQALSEGQRRWRETPAIHAAGFWSPEGATVREDVGRHNALDKLAGALADRGVDARAGAIVMSSRLSVDLVQKTARIGAPVLIGASTPTRLAIAWAEAAGITLIGRARGDAFDLYTHPQRMKG